MDLAGEHSGLRRALAAAGAASLLAQVVLLREILASSQGNELVLGVALAAWLVLSGLASAVGARFAPAPARALRSLGLLLLLSPALLILSLWLTQFARPEALVRGAPMLAVLLGSLLALAPACFVGSLCFAWATVGADDGENRAARLYVAETLGAAVAGLAFHFVFAQRLQSTWIMFGAGAVCAATGASLLSRKSVVGVVVAVVVVALAAVASLGLTASLNRARFSGEEVLVVQPSRYGLWAVLARGGQHAFFHDGTLLFTSEDQVAAEEAVHLPLLLHPRPRRILMIGGGLGGGLVEALNHGPERLDYVEMDPAVFSLALAFAGRDTWAALTDTRVHAVAGDGRAILRAATGRYDEILIALPVAQNALDARFSSRECFEDARHALAAGGILAVVTPGAETYLDVAARERHASLLATLKAVFPRVAVAPGAQTIVWSSEQPVNANPSLLAARLRERGLHPMAVGPAWLLDRLLPLRGEEYERALANVAAVENRDFRPVVYLYGLVENLRRLSPAFGRFAHAFVAATWVPWLLAASVLGVALLVLAIRRGQPAPGFAVAATGGAGMCLQLVLLLALQALRGSLYHLLGAMLAAFMAGMAGGALWGRRIFWRPRALAHACLAAALIALLVPPGLLFARVAPGGATLLVVTLAVLVGGSIGAVFSVVVFVRVGTRPRARAAAGFYAWDLVGSALGAALTSLLAIPLLGFIPVALLAATLCAAAALANLRS
jgi:spermidine synthase